MKPKPVFLTRLDTVKAVDLKPTFERLREPLRYYSNLAAGVLEVPRGFPTDFASCRVGDLQLRGRTDCPAAPTGTITAALNLACRNQASVFGDGILHELIIINRITTTTERTALRTFLASKWSVTL